MYRNAKLAMVGALLLAVGCQSPAEKQAEERSDARQDIREAGREAKTEIGEARTPQERGEEVVDATKKINEEVDEAAKGMARAADDDRGGDMKLGDNRYERFEALKDESHTAFATRADAAIAKLQADLDTARSRAGTAASKDMSDNMTNADQALAEARKDLEEVRNKTGNVIDDGRLGVATAINRAQRELSDVYDDLDKAKM